MKQIVSASLQESGPDSADFASAQFVHNRLSDLDVVQAAPLRTHRVPGAGDEHRPQVSL